MILDSRITLSAIAMNSKPGSGPTNDADEMRDEYDFRGGVRGKHAARYAAGTNVVLLEADVAEVFHDAESLDRAFRALTGILRDLQEQKPAMQR
jgi:hypothetical protein